MCLISRINVVLIKNFTQKKNNNSRVTSSPLRLPRVVKKCYGNVIKDIVIEIRRETGHFYSWTSDMLNCLVPSSIVTDWYKMGLLRKATRFRVLQETKSSMQIRLLPNWKVLATQVIYVKQRGKENNRQVN